MAFRRGARPNSAPRTSRPTDAGAVIAIGGLIGRGGVIAALPVRCSAAFVLHGGQSLCRFRLNVADGSSWLTEYGTIGGREAARLAEPVAASDIRSCNSAFEARTVSD